MQEVEYLTIYAEEINDEERARSERAAQTKESVTNNLKTMIQSYFDYFNDDEQYQLALVLLSLGLGWFETKNYHKELKNICLGCIETYCLVPEELQEAVH